MHQLLNVTRSFNPAIIKTNKVIIIPALPSPSQKVMSRAFCECIISYFSFRTEVNGNYLLQMPSGKVSVYCHMSSQGLGSCSGGGWTLVMKIDGRKVSHAIFFFFSFFSV